MNSKLHKKKIWAIFLPFIVLTTMYPTFKLLSNIFIDNWRIAWIIGLMIYWFLWGLIFPIIVLKKDVVLEIIRPQKPNIKIILLVIFPAIMTVVFRLIPSGIEFNKTGELIVFILIFSTLGNGFFEEILWRGIFMKIFPDNLFLRIIYPSILFAIWHYIPGSLNPHSHHVFGLIIGALFLGFYSSFLCKITNTLWWSIIAHISGGIVMILL